MSRMTPLAIALASLGFATAALADVSAGDRKFIESAAADGLLEVELGKVATARGSKEQIRQFGQRMVNDHRRANVELKAIASSKGIQVPTSLDRKHQDQVDELKKKDAKKFDGEYMDRMVRDHRKDMAEFKRQAKDAKDPDIRAFASRSWPTLRTHLELAIDTKAWLKAGAVPPKNFSKDISRR